MHDEQVNGARLRELREARGWDVLELARLCSLSESQVLELEEGGTQRFYSVKIKTNAARKVAQVLNVHESELIREPAVLPADAAVAAKASGSVRADHERLSANPAPKSSSWVGYIILFLVGAGAAAWWFTQAESLKPSRLAEPQAAAPRMPEVLPAPATAAPVAEVSPATAAVPTAPAAAVPAELPVADASTNAPVPEECKFENEAVTLQPVAPNKSADKVSLMLRTQAVLCVQDSTGKVWREDLKPWVGRNFIGKAPWKITSTALPGGDVYFQGEKMPMASSNAQAIILSGKPVSR
jgi:transcriptional regulator with XRE-family HTH domain